MTKIIMDRCNDQVNNTANVTGNETKGKTPVNLESNTVTKETKNKCHLIGRINHFHDN